MRTVTAKRCCRPCMKLVAGPAQSYLAALRHLAIPHASPQERARASRCTRCLFVKDQAAADSRRHARSRTQQMPANFRATATRATFRPARFRTRW